MGQGANELAEEIKEGAGMSAAENEKRWYVVHAYSGYERKVKLALEERIALSQLQDYFGEIMVPIEEVLEMRGGQKGKAKESFSRVMSCCKWYLMTIHGTWSKTRHG